MAQKFFRIDENWWVSDSNSSIFPNSFNTNKNALFIAMCILFKNGRLINAKKFSSLDMQLGESTAKWIQENNFLHNSHSRIPFFSETPKDFVLLLAEYSGGKDKKEKREWISNADSFCIVVESY